MDATPSTESFYTVISSEVADIVRDSRHWRMLANFAQKERTLTEVARQFDLKLPALTYRVNKWLDLGLLEVAREEKRRGRAMKYYRAVNRRFFIPFTLTKSETLEAFLLEMMRATHEANLREVAHILHSRGEDWGLMFECDDTEEASFSARIVDKDKGDASLRGKDQPAIFETLSKLRLDFETAKELQDELEALGEKYQARQVENQQEYLVKLGMTPLRPGTRLL